MVWLLHVQLSLCLSRRDCEDDVGCWLVCVLASGWGRERERETLVTGDVRRTPTDIIIDQDK